MTSRFNLSGEAPHFTPKRGARPTSSTPEAPASTEVIPIVKQHPNETIYQMENSASVPTVNVPTAEAKKTNKFKTISKQADSIKFIPVKNVALPIPKVKDDLESVLEVVDSLKTTHVSPTSEVAVQPPTPPVEHKSLDQSAPHPPPSTAPLYTPDIIPQETTEVAQIEEAQKSPVIASLSKVYDTDFLLSLKSSIGGNSVMRENIEARLVDIRKTIAATAKNNNNNRSNQRGGQGRGGHRNQRGPVVPVSYSDTAYNPQAIKDMKKEDRFFAAIQEAKGCLNKLCGVNKDDIFTQIVSMCSRNHYLTKILCVEEFNEFRDQFIDFLFKKAIQEVIYMPLYAELAAQIKAIEVSTGSSRAGTPDLETASFYRSCIHSVQDFFTQFFINENGWDVEAELLEVKTAREALGETVNEKTMEIERFFKLNKLRDQVLGNIKFIATLVSKSVLPYLIANQVSRILCDNPYKPHAVEALISLWKAIIDLNKSALLDESFKKALAPSIEKMQGFATDDKLDIRTRCLCENYVSDYESECKKAVAQAQQQQFRAQTSSRNHRQSATQQARPQDVRNVVNNDGFQPVKPVKGKGSRPSFANPTPSPKPMSPVEETLPEDAITKIVRSMDDCGLEDVIGQIRALHLRSEGIKVKALSKVFSEFLNWNKKHLFSQFVSILSKLSNENGYSKKIVVDGLICLLNSEEEWELLTEDLPIADTFVVEILILAMEKHVVSQADVQSILDQIELKERFVKLFSDRDVSF
ncbi:hypothetical protein RCL1_004200 [Eukaryota sp. TZLM3-RCL]